MSDESWSFDQAPNVAAIMTRQVLEGHPILRVVHYEEDHSWAFTCGTTDDIEDGKVVRMDEMLKHDPSLEEIADLPPGWNAWREAIGEQWHREETVWEEAD